MIKIKIVEFLENKLKNELQAIADIAENTKKEAIHTDMKPDSKYDTRAIEASYLAGAQAKRVFEIIRDLDELQKLDTKTKNEKVCIGSVLSLKFNDFESHYFISPTTGGFFAQIEGKSYMIIGINSPIAQASIGHSLQDSFEVETPKETRDYTITSLE